MNDLSYREKMDALNVKVKNKTFDKPVKQVKENYWSPDYTTKGSFDGIIRVLPSACLDECWFHKDFSHNFNVGSKFYSELCPTTIGKECPVCNKNSVDWKGLKKEDISKKDILRSRKWRFTSNILVVKDPIHPENNGKVFLYEYPFEIKKKFDLKIEPPEDSSDEQSFIYDFDNGCNFKLKVNVQKLESGYDCPRFVNSTFSDTNTSIGDASFIEKVISQLHDVKELKDEKRFKSYEELEKNMNLTFGIVTPEKIIVPEVPTQEETFVIEEVKFESADDVFKDIK